MDHMWNIPSSPPQVVEMEVGEGIDGVVGSGVESGEYNVERGILVSSLKDHFYIDGDVVRSGEFDGMGGGTLDVVPEYEVVGIVDGADDIDQGVIDQDTGGSIPVEVQITKDTNKDVPVEDIIEDRNNDLPVEYITENTRSIPNESAEDTNSLISIQPKQPIDLIDTNTKHKPRKKAKRAHTTGGIISVESHPKDKLKHRKRFKGLSGGILDSNYIKSSPIPYVNHELNEISDSDIEIGDTIDLKKLVKSVEVNELQAVSQDLKDSQINTQEDLTIIEEHVKVIESNSRSNDNTLIETNEISFDSTILISTPIITLRIANRKLPEKKSLAEICASTTTSSYMRPRVGLSKRSKIGSLHSYLKRSV